MNDLRFSVRALSRMRGVAAVAIAALALGIAATTTMFSAAYAALLRPLPFADADRLVLLFTTHTEPREGLVMTRWSRPLIDTLVASVRSYESIASFTPSLVAVSGAGGDPEQIDAEIVSPDYFATLRVSPARGRTFVAAEDLAPGAAPVAVLSDRLWRRRFATDPSALGRTVRVNDVPLTVVGIMPAGFSGLSDKSELWIPRTMAPRLTYAEYLTTPQLFIGVVARLKDGVAIEQANAELAGASAAFPVPAGYGDGRWSALAQRAGEARVDPSLRRSVLLLLGAAGCVLLITCGNVAGLLLARGRMRRRELAIRRALGAGRARIVRQLLSESVVLAAVAGVCGTGLAIAGVDLFARYAPSVLWTGRVSIAQFSAPSIDGRALVFAVGVTLLTGVLCGVVPALDTSRNGLTHALKEDERGGGRRRGLFRALVVTEIALAVLLLAASGLLLDSFVRMQRLRGGFDSDGVLTFWVRPPVSRYSNADGPAIIERLLTSVEGVHGVASAAVNRCTPFTGCSRTSLSFTDRPNDTDPPIVGRHYVSADYFKTLGIPVLAGRALTPADRSGRLAVTVISESAARRFWPGENAVGKRVWFGGTTGPFADPAHPVEIVGIVGDVKYEAVDWPGANGRPEFYTSYLQFSYPDTMVIVKTIGATTSSLVPALRQAVASVDSALPIYDVLTLEDRVAGALSRPRFNATLVAGFASAALLVAALGVYGMLSYSVASRRREIGVRLALGAAPRRIVRFIVAEGVQLAVAGVAIGLVAALAAGRVTRSVFVDVSPSDPRILAVVAIVMLAVACLAAFLPARRASAVDPIETLRQE